LAIQAFAKALRQIPIAIAENAGFDANELIHDLEIELMSRSDAGINVVKGCVDSMEELAIKVTLL
jgi:T-complex protein 1 subunit beta